MSILDKAKAISNKVTDSVTDFSSDELIANTIIKAVKKQESVNALLKEKGSNYRVGDIDLQMGIPPTVSFGVRRITDEARMDETRMDETSAVETNPVEGKPTRKM
jgi:hypothetical protein